MAQAGKINRPDFFTRLDSLSLPLPFGFDLFGWLRNVRMWRRYFLFCVVVCSVCWAIFGWDSTWGQLKPFIEWLLNPSKPLSEVWAESRRYYGIGNHFSAPVIYGTAWILLSLYFEGRGIKRSANFILTSALSLMNIGIFEWLWNSCYAYFQHQPWVITFAWKQVTNLYNFTAFIIVGVLAILTLYLDGYKPRLDKWTLVLTLIALGFWILWIYYPFPVQQISAETSTGTWTSNRLFPQTMYAVDLDPTDGVAIGHPYYVSNDLLHGVNVFAKIFTSAAILRFCMVVRRNE